jgi:hypothetical protein
LVGVEWEPAPAALAGTEQATLDALDAAEVSPEARNPHQTTQVAGETADAASTFPGGIERPDDMELQIHRFKMGLHDSSLDWGWLAVAGLVPRELLIRPAYWQ